VRQALIEGEKSGPHTSLDMDEIIASARQRQAWMREVVMRPLAIADLEGIWLYTYEHWGEQQATG
jgi:hypothetical protein